MDFILVSDSESPRKSSSNGGKVGSARVPVGGISPKYSERPAQSAGSTRSTTTVPYTSRYASSPLSASDDSKMLNKIKDNNNSNNSVTFSSKARAELLDAYQRLDTPKSYSSLATSSSSAYNPNNQINKEVNRGVTSVKNRMSLTNFIDSETSTGDDETDELEKRQGRASEFGHQQQSQISNNYEQYLTTNSIYSNKSIDHNSTPAEMSDFDDDILADFTGSSTYSTNSTTDHHHFFQGKYSKNNNDNLTASSINSSTSRRPLLTKMEGGRLLQLDKSDLSSISTPPRQRSSIREELDLSKTRFRQSINELLNSSPIRNGTANNVEFNEMVNAGSQLSRSVLEKVADVERMPPLKSSLSFERDLKKKNSEETVKNHSNGKDEFYLGNGETPVLSVLLQRAVWALFICFAICLTDFIMQVIISRQNAGLPAVDFSFATEFTDKIKDAIQYILEYFLSSPLNKAPYPH